MGAAQALPGRSADASQKLWQLSHYPALETPVHTLPCLYRSGRRSSNVSAENQAPSATASWTRTGLAADIAQRKMCEPMQHIDMN